MRRDAEDDIPWDRQRPLGSEPPVQPVPSSASRTPSRYRRSPANDPVVVFGVIPAAGLDNGDKLAGGEVLVVRQLAALLEQSSLGTAADPQQVARYRSVVEHAFQERTIVPVPCGTTFRSRASVARWLELHYSPLQEALDFVTDRATMRVRVGVNATPASQAASVSIDGQLWSVLRRLKGDAVAAVPVVAQADVGSAADHSATCAYLMERDTLPVFERRVAHLTSTEPHLRIDLVGPLPAYDFVKIEFGG